jgi:hypothetical protein
VLHIKKPNKKTTRPSKILSNRTEKEMAVMRQGAQQQLKMQQM